jgi:hypothetical protein
MSKSTSNALTKGYSGKFGNDLVLRCVKGVSLMTKPPDRSKTIPTPAQEMQKDVFRAASAYAVDKLNDPLLKEAYLKAANGTCSAYNMAMSDYFHPPRIKSVFTANYKGNAGETINVEALDNFMVVRVTLQLEDVNDIILESGECVHCGAGIEWVYTVQNDHLPEQGQKIRVVAYDLPNHSCEVVINL